MSQSVASSVEELSAELVLCTGRLVRAVTRATRSGATDVPTASLRLLSQLDELGPTTIGALAQADRCSQPTMSAAVRSVADRGWATKRPHPGDARASLVELTPEGRAVLGSARRERAAVVADRWQRAASHQDHDLDERDLATAVTVLRSLLDDLAPLTENHSDDTREGTA